MEATADETSSEAPAAPAALEHLTGPSRGTVTWLAGSAVDVLLRPDRFVRVTEARAGEPREGLVARLHRAGETHEIEAVEGQPVWVNGQRISAHRLAEGDMIEFGERGPLSRYCRHCDGRSDRTRVGEIVSDTVAYLRVSRQPVARRAVRALGQALGRLTRQTTLLFRLGVIFAIVVLAALAYQQSRLNALLQQQIETGATRMEGFARALTRAREEALTPADLAALREELATRLMSDAERLAALERRTLASRRVVAATLSSVVFLQGAYGFREKESGRMLRHVVDEEGRPVISPLGQPLLTLEGDGPVAERQFTGTGFAIGDGSVIATNRHLTLPWEKDASVQTFQGQELEPVMVRQIVYLPGVAAPAEVEVVRASDVADLAILRRKDGREPMPGLRLADAPPDPGDEVIVMGYPTGLRAMLAQAGEAFIEALQKAEDTDFWSVAARLAEGGHIAPLASRGIVGQVTETTIVYDADTTHGGSGGPVLDVEGRVVAVNAAILPEYGGSNFGVPVAKLRALLATAGLD